MEATLESRPEISTDFPQTFQMTQESQILVPQPGPGAAQQSAQVPTMPVSSKIDEAAVWTQAQQMTLYRSVPMETQ